MEHFLLAYNWDYKTRLAALANEPGRIEVTEFDYRSENQPSIWQTPHHKKREAHK